MSSKESKQDNEARISSDPPTSGQPRRLRNILREYYGIEKDQKVPDTDVTNIDGPSFDSDKHFHQLLRENSLGQLIQCDNKFVSEIKKLDSDMKTLVYENYNKFISATDTIRKMKTNVENMEEEMNRLSVNIDKISTCSDQINMTLASRREKIMQLSGVHRLLKKLQFLVELPSRLNKCVQVEAYSQAVKYYSQSNVVLKKYDNLPSFKAIQRECEQIMEKLRATLRTRVADPKLSEPVTVETVTLLLELKEPLEALRSEYLSSRKSYLDKGLTSFPTTTDDNITFHDHLKELNNAFLKNFLQFCSAYKSVFLDNGNATVRAESTKVLTEDFAKQLLSKYFSVVQTIMNNPKALSSVDIFKAIEMLYKDLINMHTQLPFLAVADRASDVVNGLVQNHIENVFNHLQSKVKDCVVGISRDAKAPLSAVAKTTASSIVTDAQKILEDLKMFFRLTAGMDQTISNAFLAKYSGTFTARIQVKIQQLFLFINIILQDYYEDESKQRDNNEAEITGLIILARLCLYLESDGVLKLVQSLSNLRETAAKSSRSSGMNEMTINAPDLRLRFKSSAEALLTQYIKLQSSKVSLMLWKSIDTPNWIKMKEPKGPRSAIEMVLEEIVSRRQEISDVFDEKYEEKAFESSPQLPHNNPSNRVATTPKPVPTPKSRVPFDRKSKLFGAAVEFEKNAILHEIIKVSLKSLIEYVRMKTFSKNGLQQIQIDVLYLKSVLSSSIAFSQTFNTLLDEAISSASDRSSELILLDHNTASSLCEPKLEKWRNPVSKPKEENTETKSE